MNKKRKQNKPRVLLWDCETAYTTGAVWGLYDQNVAEVIEEPYMLTFAYKWLDESRVHVRSLPDYKTFKRNQKDDSELIKELHSLFEEADIIVAHNGNSFDQKWAYARFAVNGLQPPSPAKYVDTKLVAKRYFRFNSNSLNNLGKYFKLGQKIDTGGIELWVDIIEHNKQRAWDLMCRYNKQDVVLLEKVYLKMLPYITNHPNINGYTGNSMNCPGCNGCNLQRRGLTPPTQSGMRHQRWQCMDCGRWTQLPISGKGLMR